MITESKFNIIVKTKSTKSEFMGFDKANKAYILKIKAIPKKGEANKEIVKFLSKLLKKQVRITSGFRSKEKMIEVL